MTDPQDLSQYNLAMQQAGVGPSSPQQQAALAQQQLQQQQQQQYYTAAPQSMPTQFLGELNKFWQRQYKSIENTKDFKSHELPLARIKKIMKSDEDVRMISAEAPILFAKACEMFVLELTLRAWIHTEESKRRTLQRNDIATAISKTDIFDFLIDIVPREDGKPAKKDMGARPMGMPADMAAQQQYMLFLQQQAMAQHAQAQAQGAGQSQQPQLDHTGAVVGGGEDTQVSAEQQQLLQQQLMYQQQLMAYAAQQQQQQQQQGVPQNAQQQQQQQMLLQQLAQMQGYHHQDPAQLASLQQQMLQQHQQQMLDSSTGDAAAAAAAHTDEAEADEADNA